MGVEVGGRATKLGNSYEGLWAVRQALYVLGGHCTSLLWEPIGEDEKGVDLWVTANDGHRIGYQLKRQDHDKGYWSVADLRSEGILQAAQYHLERDSDAEYVLISSSGVPHLADLTDRSTRNDTAERFLSDHVNTHQKRRAVFKQLMDVWGLSSDREGDVERALDLLTRIRFEVMPRTSLGHDHLKHIAEGEVDADPVTVIAFIGNLLVTHLGRTFYSDTLRDALVEQGFQLRRLAGDPRLAEAIARLRTRFDSAIRPHLIAAKSIQRPEATRIINQIRSDKPPRIVFVHGAAGSGKSVVLHQILSQLHEDGTPAVALQLHTFRPEHTPYAFGKQTCSLPGSLAASLRALAVSRRAVVLLDQIDSLRLTSSHSHGTWHAFVELVDDVLADRDLIVVMACRSFDLDNDRNIAAWRQDLKRRDEPVFEAPIRNLPEAIVADVVSSFGTPFSSLSPRQQQLLTQPGTLAIWCSLAERDELPDCLNNGAQLMGRFVEVARNEAVREHGLQAGDIENALSTLVKYLDTQGRLTAPVALIAGSTPAITALCSVGLLSRDGSQVSFAHQSYLDYMVAQEVLSGALMDGRNPLEWVKANQSLFRRDQLRQLSNLLRESDPQQYAMLLRELLHGPDIRFHLKHLVLGLLRVADPVLDEEAELVCDLSHREEWADHVFSLIRGQAHWFHVLERRGVLAQWLADPDTYPCGRHVFRFLTSVSHPCGDRIDRLLSTHQHTCGTRDIPLLELLPFNPCDDSPRMAALRLSQTRSGILAHNDHFMDHLAEQDPARMLNASSFLNSVLTLQYSDICCSSFPEVRSAPGVWPAG